jgi:hypothetical protein
MNLYRLSCRKTNALQHTSQYALYQTLTLQRAQLQDGKCTLIDGIKGFDGKTISQYARVNRSQTHIEMFNENPDRKRDNSQRHSNRQLQDNSQKRGRGI